MVPTVCVTEVAVPKQELVSSESSGLAVKIKNVISKCPRDIQQELWRSIVLCGGTTVAKGLWGPATSKKNVLRDDLDRYH